MPKNIRLNLFSKQFTYLAYSLLLRRNNSLSTEIKFNENLLIKSYIRLKMNIAPILTRACQIHHVHEENLPKLYPVLLNKYSTISIGIPARKPKTWFIILKANKPTRYTDSSQVKLNLPYTKAK